MQYLFLLASCWHYKNSSYLLINILEYSLPVRRWSSKHIWNTGFFYACFTNVCNDDQSRRRVWKWFWRIFQFSQDKITHIWYIHVNSQNIFSMFLWNFQYTAYDKNVGMVFKIKDKVHLRDTVYKTQERAHASMAVKHLQASDRATWPRRRSQPKSGWGQLCEQGVPDHQEVLLELSPNSSHTNAQWKTKA